MLCTKVHAIWYQSNRSLLTTSAIKAMASDLTIRPVTKSLAMIKANASKMAISTKDNDKKMVAIFLDFREDGRGSEEQDATRGGGNAVSSRRRDAARTYRGSHGAYCGNHRPTTLPRLAVASRKPTTVEPKPFAVLPWLLQLAKVRPKLAKALP